MKPLEAMADLRHACELLIAGQPLPPSLRVWLVNSMRKRLATPGASLDRLLGLRSRAGGRLHADSKLPERDRAIRDLAGASGPVATRADALMERLRRHRQCPDADLARIEREYGRIPRSRAQLRRIIGGHTCASRAPNAHSGAR
jgi:hypothetical protein